MKFIGSLHTIRVATILLTTVTLLFAKDSKVRIHVRPEQASIFVDGVLFGDSSRTIKVAPGKQTIGVYNYGYTPQLRDITLESGKNPGILFELQPVPGTVAGPQGRIQIEGASRAAVLLNGKTPEFLVGHGDEFNNSGEFLNCCAQQLIVPAGTHQLTIIAHDKEVWSGPVKVQPNQRVVVHVPSGKQKVKPWPEGAALSSANRFTAGIASASVAVAPVSGNLMAKSAQINCGEAAQLAWSTAETVQRVMTAEAEPPKQLEPSGELTIHPKATTTYNLEAAGPGGTLKQSVTVDVNTAVQSSLQASPAEVRYRKIGDKVIEQGVSTLTWSASNANAVSIEPLGAVSASDSRELKPTPRQDNNGPIDETQTYTLTAKNDCGGSATQTATVRISGAIEPIPEISLASIFFPTGLPDKSHPEGGLVKSQQDMLAEAAAQFKKYLEYDPDAQLRLIGNADQRDSNARNKPLSERRANRVKDYLVSLGVPDSKIDIVAQGDEKQLDPNTVKQLHANNPKKATKTLGSFQDLVWAYNRRVDIVLLPKDVASAQYFPGEADDASILVDSRWPNHKEIVTLASQKERLPADATSESQQK
jgi:outer membrane protein OmpA-like peptidoglycan-associated protein